jgi:2-polyprenyl-6-methoxyphenol hydroxylase-like FAD-dependent oxidoreductase
MDTQVLIAGGGPVGLMMALELDKQGIKAILIEKNPTTTHHPKMDITNGRSMELFRRWGVDKKLRAIAIPENHGFNVIWVSNLAGHELARFTYPTPEAYRKKAKSTNDGTYTLEPAMRVSQILIEPCLKKHLATNSPNIDLRYGWSLETFTQDTEGVTATIKHYKTGAYQQIRSLYLAGCEGAGSVSRKILGIGRKEIDVFGLVKKAGVFKVLGHGFREMKRGLKPPDGRVYMIHFSSPELKLFERFGPAWHIQSPNGSVIISQNDKDTWTMHVPLRKGEEVHKIAPKQKLFELIGQEFECTINIANAWTPRLSVINHFGRGRVWLAGDAVRQVTPAGGYGMNTGVGDALALGWVLAAVIKGWGSPQLLEAYEAERRPVAIRNRGASAAHVLVRLKIAMAMRDAMYENSAKGAKTRKKIGQEILKLSNLENEAIGIEADYRYDNSPIICMEETGSSPPFEWNKLHPSTYPGARIPPIWLKDGRAIMDLLGNQFTLIRFVDMDISAFEQAAKKRNFPLSILDIREDAAAKIYEKKLILVRPDQHVAWRGDKMPADALVIIDKVRGA